MNVLKKILGICWLLIAAIAFYYCVFVFGIPKAFSQKQEDVVFGCIILIILTPIIVGGLGIFGVYALKGEYDNDKM